MLATKENAAKLSIVSTSLLILMTIVASIVTGSISIRADAAHGVLDLAGAITTFIGVRISGRPADKEHPFGHGKAENVSSVLVAGLIFVAAGFIAYTAVKRLITGAILELVEIGIHVEVAVMVINLLAAWYVSRVARKTESLALRAQASHMFGDVLSTVAVLVGLVLVWLTGLNVFDPIVALLVALLILKIGYDTIRKSFGGLIDVKLPEAEENVIRECILEHGSEMVGFHQLRTRKAGNQRYIDLHLVLSKDASVDEAHQICDDLERHIANKLLHTSVTIHVEPCSTTQCARCSVICNLRRQNP